MRAELLQREQAAPQEYLHVQGTHHRNLLNQLVLEGDIANQATLARFKYPVLSVTWYSQTQTELGTQQYLLYELVRPQGTQHYKLKTTAPNGSGHRTHWHCERDPHRLTHPSESPAR